MRMRARMMCAILVTIPSVSFARWTTMALRMSI